MSLVLKQSGIQPLGNFDGYDDDYLTITGGEVGRLINVPFAIPSGDSTDSAAADVYDGYSPTPYTRPAVSRTLTATASTYRPLFLLDEGTVGYGTMFGTVVGGVVGTTVPNPSNLTGANVLGPHTATGSGKVTCWDKPGLYAVTTDSLAASLTTASNVSSGDPLYANTAGNITATAGEAFDNASGTPTIIGRFVEFSTGGSLVTTPNYLTSSAVQMNLREMVFHFRIEN
jgi:hypothetical protein